MDSRPQEEGLLLTEKFTTGLLKSLRRPHQPHPVPRERIHPKTLNTTHTRKGSGQIPGTKVQLSQKGCIQPFRFQAPWKPQKVNSPIQSFHTDLLLM